MYFLLFIGLLIGVRSTTMDIEAIDSKLLELLIFKLDFIRKLSDLLPELTSEQEREMVELIKQYSQYDFAAEIVRKIQRKYHKIWF